MNNNSPFPPEQLEYAETIQEFYDDIREYYDELFPLDEGAVALMKGLVEDFRKESPIQPPPVCRYLGVGCATGTLENRISDTTVDVTGIDRNPTMIETSKRRMRRGYSTTRFFEMPAIDVRRYLKPASFNIAACVGNTLPYVGDETLIRKFIHDIRALLAPGGTFVVQTLNFDALTEGKPALLRERSSVRASLERKLLPGDDGYWNLEATLIHGNGKRLTLQKGTRMVPVTRDRLESWGREAGFTTFQYGSDYAGRPWEPDGEYTVAILG